MASWAMVGRGVGLFSPQEVNSSAANPIKVTRVDFMQEIEQGPKVGGDATVSKPDEVAK